MRIATSQSDPLPTNAHFIEIRAVKADQPIVASTPDPMKALLSEIALLPKGVQAGLQVLVREDPFTRLKYSRKADDKTRKKPDPKMSPIIISDNESKVPILHPSAEERRLVRWLDDYKLDPIVGLVLPGAGDAAHIGGHDHDIAHTALELALDIQRKHRRSVQVVHRNIKEALDLGCVQIHGQHPLDPGFGDHIGDQLGGDGGAGLGSTVLTGVAEIGDHGGDACGG